MEKDGGLEGYAATERERGRGGREGLTSLRNVRVMFCSQEGKVGKEVGVGRQVDR